MNTKDFLLYTLCAGFDTKSQTIPTILSEETFSSKAIHRIYAGYSPSQLAARPYNYKAMGRHGLC